MAAFETGFHATIPDRHAVLRRAVRVGREAARQALGLSRREPSLHRRADGRAARPRRPADHLVPPRRLELAVRDSRRQERGHVDGHEPADRACRTTTASATSIRSRLPVIMQADGQVAGRKCSTTLAEQSGLLGPERRQRRRARPGRSGRAGQRAGAAGARRVRRRDPAVPGRVCWSSWAAPTRSSSPAASARTASTFAPALCADLEELGIVLDPAAERRGQGRSADQRRRQPRADLDRADQRRADRRPADASDLLESDVRRINHVRRQSHRLASSRRRRSSR